MIRSLGDKTPKVAETAWISEFAYVVGDVEIGEYSSIWPGVTIRADGEAKVVIGNYVNVQEGAVIHGNGLVIEDYVTVGHSVVVHGDRIGTGSLLGNNCTFLHRSTIGKECLIAANSVVLSQHQRTRPLLHNRHPRHRQAGSQRGAGRQYEAHRRPPGRAKQAVQGQWAVGFNLASRRGNRGRAIAA